MESIVGVKTEVKPKKVPLHYSVDYEVKFYDYEGEITGNVIYEGTMEDVLYRVAMVLTDPYYQKQHPGSVSAGIYFIRKLILTMHAEPLVEAMKQYREAHQE